MPRYPVIVGATGGSGTRALRAVLERRGAYMGLNVNATADAVDVIPFFDRFVGETLRQTRRLDYDLADLPAALRNAALAHLEAAMLAYLGPHATAGAPWGFKGPRAMFMLPFFRELFPDMSFVQLVRDGRDMAVSRNQAQLHRYYETLFGEPMGDAVPVAAARLWAKANGEAADWCQRHLPGRHLVLRYEQLCDDPLAAIAGMMEFLDWPCRPEQLAPLAGLIEPSSGIGRWRDRPDAAAIAAAAASGLARFGYG